MQLCADGIVGTDKWRMVRKKTINVDTVKQICNNISCVFIEDVKKYYTLINVQISAFIECVINHVLSVYIVIIDAK